MGQKGGPISPDGTEEVDIDLPTRFWTQNTAGIDRAGLCVWTSCFHSCLWSGIPDGKAVLEYLRTQPGGGWPQRVDRVFKAKAPGVQMRQYVGRDPSVIEAVLKAGRLPAVTHTRWHMVNCLHLGKKWACILDNNRTSPPEYLWYPREKWLQLHTDGGYGWVVWFVPAGPPPAPYNAQAVGQLADVEAGITWDRVKVRDEAWGPDGKMSVEQIKAELAAEDQRTGLGPLRITVIGPAAAQDRLRFLFAEMSTTNPAIQAARVNYYSDDQWQVQDVGFVRPGPVAVYVQEQDGKVVARMDDIPTEDQIVTAIRRARPDYDPARDWSPMSRLEQIRYALYLLAAAIIFTVLVRKK